MSRQPRPGGRMYDMMKQVAARLARCAVPALALVLMLSSYGATMDREDLAKTMKAIPPNGPFWKYGNVVMRAKSRKAGLDPVVFPHWLHRARFTCRVCHQELGFSMRSGDSGITRSQYLAGKYCGACHNGVTAFTVADGPQAQCKRCHMENTKSLETQFKTFAAKLPMAPFGNGIDWSTALNDGIITPYNALDPAYTTMKLPDNLRKPLKLGTGAPRSDVRFSHEDHYAELDCSSCHPDIFSIKKKSTESFSMENNLYGKFCGVCHMLVSFPMNDCRRCHPSMSNSAY